MQKNQNLLTNDESTILLKVAQTNAEKEAVYNFRYNVYVEEMDKHRIDADLNHKMISDLFDDWAINIYAEKSGKIVGVNRLNIAPANKFPKDIIHTLDLKRFIQLGGLEENENITLMTKLMVDKAFRNSPLLYLLMKKSYELFAEYDIQFGFGGCNLHLLRLYEQMGLHRYAENFIDGGYGLLFPIVMLADDVDHFRRVRSPLYRLARKRTNKNLDKVTWFHETFQNNSNIMNSQIISADALWDFLCRTLKASPTNILPILDGLSVEEAKIFVHSCGIIIQCQPNNLLTLQGEVSYSHTILLSGKLQSKTIIKPQKHYLPGDYFGANGLTEQNKHIEDIVAIAPSQILVLTGLGFQRFSNSNFEIAHKIVKNCRQISYHSPYKLTVNE